MDHVSAGETTRDTARARRRRMRSEARAQRTTSPRADDFRTPEWLDRSFVLPLTEPQVTAGPNDVPSQPVPHHDSLSADAPTHGPTTGTANDEPTGRTFVRPRSQEIDFARVIRRSEVTRAARRTAMVSTGVTGLALIAYLLTASPLALVATAVVALVALVATGIRVRLSTAPIPHVER